MVRIVGGGPIGASIGQALTRVGVDVAFEDTSARRSTSIARITGRPARLGDRPALVVIAVDDDRTAENVDREIRAYPEAVVTDTARIKTPIVNELLARGTDLTRYIGSDPMVGPDHGDAFSARPDLFRGQHWVICAHQGTTETCDALVGSLAISVGATPVRMTSDEHDDAIAIISHIPHLVAAMLAGRLASAPEALLALAGPGLRDTTRLAASPVDPWIQMVLANAGRIVPVLDALLKELRSAADALRLPPSRAARQPITDLIHRGNAGVSRLPGKHGHDDAFNTLVVIVDDSPGQLGRLFRDLASLRVNIEDIRLEHSPGAPIGFAELSIRSDRVHDARRGLSSHGWPLADI